MEEIHSYLNNALSLEKVIELGGNILYWDYRDKL